MPQKGALAAQFYKMLGFPFNYQPLSACRSRFVQNTDKTYSLIKPQSSEAKEQWRNGLMAMFFWCSCTFTFLFYFSLRSLQTLFIFFIKRDGERASRLRSFWSFCTFPLVLFFTSDSIKILQSFLNR